MATAAEELHGEVAAALQGVDQRYTDGRRALVAALAEAEHPASMPELLDRMRGVPQSSAYRNLAVLEQAGVVRRVLGADGAGRFELAEHLTSHHHHLVCTSCGSVRDFAVAPALERALDRAIDAVAEATGFAAEGHRLDLVGTCAECAADEGGAASGGRPRST